MGVKILLSIGERIEITFMMLKSSGQTVMYPHCSSLKETTGVFYLLIKSNACGVCHVVNLDQQRL